MIFNKIKNLKFDTINFNNLLVNFFLTIFLLVIFSFFVQKSFNTQKIVIFDKEAVFQDYLKDLKNIANNSESKTISQSYLKNRNELFIKYMISDLYAYQNNHHVFIVKRSSLSAPNAFLKTKIDITGYIENQLKKQGVLNA